MSEWSSGMADRHVYYVWGGVFTDMSFRELEPGTEESFGPFHTEAEADQTWREGMRRKVDIAQHRLFVLKIPRPGGSGG
jgi:hypothetical protein